MRFFIVEFFKKKFQSNSRGFWKLISIKLKHFLDLPFLDNMEQVFERQLHNHLSKEPFQERCQFPNKVRTHLVRTLAHIYRHQDLKYFVKKVNEVKIA